MFTAAVAASCSRSRRESSMPHYSLGRNRVPSQANQTCGTRAHPTENKDRRQLGRCVTRRWVRKGRKSDQQGQRWQRHHANVHTHTYTLTPTQTHPNAHAYIHWGGEEGGREGRGKLLSNASSRTGKRREAQKRYGEETDARRGRTGEGVRAGGGGAFHQCFVRARVVGALEARMERRRGGLRSRDHSSGWGKGFPGRRTHESNWKGG